MFFPHLIKSIQPGDRVLEIGPGSSPHPRSDAFLEMRFSTEKDARHQRADLGEFHTEKPIHYYDGGVFPFKTKEFDYVICSHVIEHVDDVPGFLAEMFRVAHRGYVEYPTIHYDYLYNFDVHLNFVKRNGEALLYLKKADTPLGAFRPVQELLYRSLQLGYSSLVDELRDVMFEGFEWLEPFTCRKASGIEELTFPISQVKPIPLPYRLAQRVLGRLKRFALASRREGT